MSNKFGSINLLSNNKNLELYCSPGLADNYSIALPATAPANNQTWKYNSTTQQFEWVSLLPDISLSFNAPNNEFSVNGTPYTGGTGNITIDWLNQGANLFFASPNGSIGKPLFRFLVDNDLPSQISAARVSGVLSKVNIPSGTNATTFQIDSLNSGVVLKNDVGSLKVFNSDQSALADIYCNTLFVTNGIDQSNVTTVNLGDSILILNSNFISGTPIANSGLSVRRGSSTNSTIQWNESTDIFECGIDDNLKPIARKTVVTITNTDLSLSQYTFNHNLREKYPLIQVVNNLNQSVGIGATFTNSNTCILDFSRLTPLTGSWVITAIG